MNYVSLNGNLVARGRALVGAESDGLFYGAGCFETLRSYNGQFLHLDRHLERLNRGVRFLLQSGRFAIPEDQIRREIKHLLEQNDLVDADARVRIQVSLSRRNGYTLPKNDNIELNRLISTDPIQNSYSDAISLATSEITVVPVSSRPAELKLSNMLHYRQAAIEAKQVDADDALMLTTDGHVAETSVANVFWEKEGTVYTPSKDCDILPGITRSTVLFLLKKLEISCREGRFKKEHLMKANQIFVCNSIRELVWVKSVDQQVFDTDTDLKNDLLHEFEKYKSKMCQ